MKEFKIIIEETISQEFTIMANDENDVFDIAREKYHNGELVLEPGNLVNTCIAIVDDNGDASEFKDI